MLTTTVRLRLGIRRGDSSVSKHVQRYFGNEQRETHRGRLASTTENSNNGASLVLLVIVEIGAVKYRMSWQLCKRTNTRIKDVHSNSDAMRHAMRTKARIDSRGSCGGE